MFAAALAVTAAPWDITLHMAKPRAVNRVELVAPPMDLDAMHVVREINPVALDVLGVEQGAIAVEEVHLVPHAWPDNTQAAAQVGVSGAQPVSIQVLVLEVAPAVQEDKPRALEPRAATGWGVPQVSTAREPVAYLARLGNSRVMVGRKAAVDALRGNTLRRAVRAAALATVPAAAQVSGCRQIQPHPVIAHVQAVPRGSISHLGAITASAADGSIVMPVRDTPASAQVPHPPMGVRAAPAIRFNQPAATTKLALTSAHVELAS